MIPALSLTAKMSYGYSHTGTLASHKTVAISLMSCEASCSCRRSSLDLTKTGQRRQPGREPCGLWLRRRADFSAQPCDDE